MNSDDQSQSLKYEEEEYQFAAFSKLQPVFEEKIANPKKNLIWMKQQDKENKKSKKAAKKQLKEENERRSRSRSRQREKKKIRQTKILTKEQQRSSDNMIVISDDEQYQKRDQFKSQFLSLNWKQRRKLNRLFERQQRNYRLGKQKDSLSFTIFNTIESYFR